jgi:hypothetical protein
MPTGVSGWQMGKELREGDHRDGSRGDVTPAANLVTAGDFLKNQHDSC